MFLEKNWQVRLGSCPLLLVGFEHNAVVVAEEGSEGGGVGPSEGVDDGVIGIQELKDELFHGLKRFLAVVVSLSIGLADEGGGRSREGSERKKCVLVAIEDDAIDGSAVNN